jgi:hypothetical protein
MLLSIPPNGYQSQLDNIIRLDATSSVLSGSIDALIELLFSGDTRMNINCFRNLTLVKSFTNIFTLGDPNFHLAWILSYRSFMTPYTFLCEMSKQYPSDYFKSSSNFKIIFP